MGFMFVKWSVIIWLLWWKSPKNSSFSSTSKHSSLYSLIKAIHGSCWLTVAKFSELQSCVSGEQSIQVQTFNGFLCFCQNNTSKLVNGAFLDFFLIAFLQFCFFVIEFAYLLIFYLKSHCNHQHHMIILFWYTLCSSGLLIILFLFSCYASGLFIKSILFLVGYLLLYYFYWFECKFTILRTTVTNDTICCAEY